MGRETYVFFTNITQYIEVEVEFEEPIYSVDEDGGSVTVCVVTNAEVASDFDVDVIGMECNPVDAIGKCVSTSGITNIWLM